MTKKLSRRRSTNSSSTSERNNRVGICGHGELGKAVAAFFAKQKPLIYDLFEDRTWPKDTVVGYLHICSEEPLVYEHTRSLAPFLHQYAAGALIFIHADVAPGFTQKLQKETGNAFIVHTPFRGVLKDIPGSLASFTQPVGADSAGAARLAIEHLQSVGIKCEAVYGSSKTEAGPTIPVSDWMGV